MNVQKRESMSLKRVNTQRVCSLPRICIYLAFFICEVNKDELLTFWSFTHIVTLSIS